MATLDGVPQQEAFFGQRLLTNAKNTLGALADFLLLDRPPKMPATSLLDIGFEDFLPTNTRTNAIIRIEDGKTSGSGRRPSYRSPHSIPSRYSDLFGSTQVALDKLSMIDGGHGRQYKPFFVQNDGSKRLQSLAADPFDSHLFDAPMKPLTTLPRPPSMTDETQSSHANAMNALAYYEPIGVTGVAMGIPNQAQPDRPVFGKENFDRLCAGEQQITLTTPVERKRILSQNIFQLVRQDEKRVKKFITADSQVLQVAGRVGPIDLVKQYHVPSHVIEAMDTTCELGIAAGLEALQDAGICITNADGTAITGLPEHMQRETGIIFASSFPGIDACVDAVTKAITSKLEAEVAVLRAQLASGQSLSSSEEAEIRKINDKYEYDRKLVFKLLVMANNQLAELLKAKGPNTQINGACAGMTQAVAIAQDWLCMGRCKRVVVVSADNATSERLLPYIGTGFLVLGAATTANTVELAAQPFGKCRSGMVMGAGAVGMVLETRCAAVGRGLSFSSCKAQLVDTHISNSAFHACLMDETHIREEFEFFIRKLEERHGLHREKIAPHLVYFSHETGTSVCAKYEIGALRYVFGNDFSSVTIANTKGLTGHPMSVSFEEVMGVHAINTCMLPPIANLQDPDPALELLSSQLSRGGFHGHIKYLLRFSAGFGSQVALSFYSRPV